MKSFASRHLLLALLLLLPALTFAGEIFGTLKKDGKGMAKQEVIFTQNGKEIAKTVTDDKGYFSVVIKPIGKLTISLTGYEGAVFDVFSTNNSSGYTLSLVKEGDKWTLKKQ
ncbi:MAG TPA: hypothetical protein VJ508_14995 [Saprospiraceae bacterium]|nr:hypothetical protein [Saprospiraceae bacterium]